MAGVKGLSGRKAFLEEKTIEEIVLLSAKTIKQALEDLSLKLEFRAELAAKVFVKRMPQRLLSDGSVNFQIVQVYVPNAIEQPEHINLETTQRPAGEIPSELGV